MDINAIDKSITNIDNNEIEKNKKYLLKCLLENCRMTDNQTILASPDTEPDYQYEWVRDASLTVSLLLDVVKSTEFDLEFDDIKDIIDGFITNHHHYQNICYENNISLGEPKFNKDRSIFKEEWGRPQNDGPALRVIALSKYYLDFTDVIDDETKLMLYDGEFPHTKSIIKRDLEYICRVYNDKGYDLWEEILGDHFYTLVVQYRALLEGSCVAALHGDDNASNYYIHIASLIKDRISSFHVNGRIISTKNMLIYDENGNLIRTNMVRKYDMSILLAYIHADIDMDCTLVNTVLDMIEIFKAMYPINEMLNISLCGRYPCDVYFDGNPWVLLTAAVATMVMKIKKSNYNIVIEDRHKDLWEYISEGDVSRMYADLMTIESLNKQVIPDMVMSFAEQINKNNINYVSADRLSWNYVELLRIFL